MVFLGEMSEKGNHKDQRYPGPIVKHEERYQQHARLYFQAARGDIKEVGYILNQCRGLIKISEVVRLEIIVLRFGIPSAQFPGVVSRLGDEREG